MKALLLLLACLSLAVLNAQSPKRQHIIDDTLSPDGRFGVTEPSGEKAKHNQLLEAKTGRVVIELGGLPGFQQMNHGGTNATWSPDGKRLLWIVDGKWGPLAVAYVDLDDKGEAAQVDVLKAAHAELLARTRKAHPKAYAAAVKVNKGNGAAYPEGFTVNAVVPEGTAPPLRFSFALTSNPKGIEDFPQLDAYIEGTLTVGRKMEWSNFHAWDAASGERERAEAEGVGEELAHLEDEIDTKLKGAEKKKFKAEQLAWEAKQKKEFSGEAKLAELCDLELTRRGRVSVKARVVELQKRYNLGE